MLLSDLPEREHVVHTHASVTRRQQVFGYTEEELRLILAPMATGGAEPIGSMGTDTPIAALSDKPRLLFDYFSQLFAQVTNPPLDAIREELVTSLYNTIGPERNLLDPGPASCRRLVLPFPVLDNDSLAKIVRINRDGDLPGYATYVARVCTRSAAAPDLARFFLATEDGTRFAGATVGQPGPTVIQVEAPAVTSFAETVVLGGAEARAVFEQMGSNGTSGSGPPNTLGVKPVTTRPSPPGSVSDGPDLVGVEPVRGTQEVDFVFDEPVRGVHLAVDSRPATLPTDVFVRNLDSGRVTRPSVDGDGRQAPGSSGSPACRGTVVTSLSTRRPHSFPTVPGNGKRPTCATSSSWNSLRKRSTSAPSWREPRRDQPGRSRSPTGVRGGSPSGRWRWPARTSGNFRIVSNGCLRTLASQQRCTVTVAFAPVADGRREAELTVTDNAPGSPRRGTLRGLRVTPPPTLTVDPELGSPGTATLVSGTGFPPATTLELSWASTAAGVGPAPLAVARRRHYRLRRPGPAHPGSRPSR